MTKAEKMLLADAVEVAIDTQHKLDKANYKLFWLMFINVALLTATSYLSYILWIKSY